MNVRAVNSQFSDKWSSRAGVQTVGSRLLEVDNLTKVFTKGQGFVRSTIVAVNKVTFSLDSDRPEIFTLAGESGEWEVNSGQTDIGLRRAYFRKCSV